MSNDAWSGWGAHEHDYEPAPTIEAQAGWLAREIATHTDTEHDAGGGEA